MNSCPNDINVDDDFFFDEYDDNQQLVVAYGTTTKTNKKVRPSMNSLSLLVVEADEETASDIDGDYKNKDGTLRHAACFSSICILLFLVSVGGMIAVFLSFTTTTSRSYNNSIHPHYGNYDRDTQPAVNDTVAAIKRLEQVRDYLIQKKIVNYEYLKYSNSPQTLAAQWIATIDQAQIDIPKRIQQQQQQQHTTNNDTNAPIYEYEENNPMEYDFLQRYILAVFYFSMNGHNNVWLRNFDFLSPYPACQWYQLMSYKKNEETAMKDYNTNHPNHTFQNTWEDKKEIESLYNHKGTILAKGANDNAYEYFDRIEQIQELIRVHKMKPMGISCTNNYKVDGIFMDYNNLTGSLPKELGLLSELTVFNLEFNNIIGPLPLNFQQLTNLKQLYLGYNSLWGTLPTFLQKLTALDTLLLDYNMFTGSLPNELKHLNQLSTLALNDNLFHGKISHIFNNNNNNNRNVQSIADSIQNVLLQNNYFSEEIRTNNNHDTTQDPFLYNLQNLEILDLSNNDFYGSFPIHLLLQHDSRNKEIHSSNLRVLNLHDNRISSFMYPLENDNETTTAITTNGNHALQYLALQNNNITGDAYNISKIVSNLHSLKYLDLSNNLLTTMPMSLLPDNNQEDSQSFLVLPQKLEFLFLGNNPYKKGTIPILTFLASDDDDTDVNINNTLSHNNFSLKVFSLKNTQRTGTIPNDIYFLGHSYDGSTNSSTNELIVLDLEHNQLTGTIPRGLLSDTLQYLLLSNNQVSITSSTTPIPSSVSPVTNLKKITLLNNNNISGNLDAIFCKDKSTIGHNDNVNNHGNSKKLPYIIADCDEVQCSCCNLCCSSNSDSSSLFGTDGNKNVRNSSTTTISSLSSSERSNRKNDENSSNIIIVHNNSNKNTNINENSSTNICNSSIHSYDDAYEVSNLYSQWKSGYDRSEFIFGDRVGFFQV